MKTALLAAVLLATSFAASADHHDSIREVTSGPGKTRAEVISELEVAKAAGLINLSDSELRQAERISDQQNASNLTRQQVQQEVIALRQLGRHEIQGDHR